jgi:hypothetical protein
MSDETDARQPALESEAELAEDGPWWEYSDSAHAVAAEELNADRWPIERAAAQELARAQRDLGNVSGSSPEPSACGVEDGVGDIGVDAGSLEKVVASERWARDAALTTVAAARRFDDMQDCGASAECAAAVARARAAIAAMTGPDPAAAQAAREDVLNRWHDDDRAAEQALIAGDGRDSAGDADGWGR